MKKNLITLVVLFFAITGYAQFNNSWIDYSKTYYKFKLAKDTLTRIYQPALAASGLSSVPAENFQLWRNGKQVRIFTSVPTGVMGTGDYLEFWGQMNDGKPDKDLYRNADYQLNDKYSLETDTATYYLTVNAAGGNLRYLTALNNTAGNTLPADPYFMRRIETNYRSQINKGYAEVYSEYIYSSSYDKGEGFTSDNITPCTACNLVKNLQNLNRYAAGPANSVMFTIAAAGNAPNQRNIFANFFNTQVLLKPMHNFNYLKDTIKNLPLSLLNNPSDLLISINGTAADITDRMVVSCFSVTYPATFNFNNEKNFYFELKDNALGNYLVINNFNTNGIAPVLYDYNNAKRIIGDISTAGQVKFALAASSDTLRRFNLMSGDVSNINIVTALTSKTFIDYSTAPNQGDYLIISNPVLYNNGSGVNNVELYRQYRSSVTGGGFNARVYNIDELNEQFGFGIKKHPSAVRNFIQYARQQFNIVPKYVFIIGHGLSYIDYTGNQNNVVADQLNLVPTFGWPASDVLLACQPGTTIPTVPIGRLGAINGVEVGIYLDKIKQYEQAQQSPSQTIADKGWMKNMLHTVGASNIFEEAELLAYMNNYKAIVEDTLFGAHVETFSKTSVSSIEQQQSQRISELFQQGLSYIKYFGHSSANELAINLNYPENYQNAGKYPFMHISGCTVGNFFAFNVDRLVNYSGMSLSEKYILLNQKGSIGFLGSTYLGVANPLNFYNEKLYEKISRTMYGNTIGNQLKATLQDLSPAANDPIVRMHLEEINLHGDPALKINAFAKPDYVIEDQLVKFTPSIISVADQNFNVDVKVMNIGRAIRDSIRVKIRQKLPNDSIRVLYNQIIPATLYMDSFNLTVPINPVNDKGLNKLLVSVDVDGRVDELSELNNELTKDFYIFEDELRPVSPYNYSIINQQNFTYYASTANPLSANRQYVMEVDTTALFNSSFKKSYNTSGVGGVIEFRPSNITYADSTVYYWRTSTVPAAGSNYIWNNASFIYLPNSTAGFNQSHSYQHLKSAVTDINYSVNNKWKFNASNKTVKIKNGVFPTAANQSEDFAVEIDGANNIQSACGVSAIIFNVFSPFDMVPWINNYPGTGLYGSDDPCGPTRKWNFQYNVLSQAKRVAAVNFLDLVPDGYYVTARYTSGTISSTNTYANDWMNDTLVLGSGKSLYHRLKDAGFADIDSFNRPRAFNFIYKKRDVSFTPAFLLSQGITDKIILNAIAPTIKSSGTITSPLYGPVTKWSMFHWRGNREELTPGDSVRFNIVGVTNTGVETNLFTIDSTLKDVDISSINTSLYPYLKLKMFTRDTIQGTPYQLRYWRVNGDYVPEGAVAPNILFVMKDTATQGEIVDFKLAFKNISQTAFADSMKINFTITNSGNNTTPVLLQKGKVLVSGDTLVISYKIDTKNYPGSNIISVDVNPNSTQLEQYHFNNVLYKNLYVKADNFNPLLDVTFDGVHILNKDIVSAKPHILVNLKDESRFLALSDTAYIKVQVRFPDGSLHSYNFGDSMRFTPANLSSGNNTATIDFLPSFPQEGEYELMVSGRDVVGNTAGTIDYHVTFTVITKAMISNLLNYPNPFTTSTAFVFTVTGSQVPQNIRIQILTITGKIVREITKDELGPIHVGRNITEYKWDGTDTYGGKLANGVYLYRVLTNLNGKALDKYKVEGDNTDKFFNKGYGKMVIIR